MEKSVNNIHTLDGQMIWQQDRLSNALLPSYVKIDGRTLVDRLVYFSTYAYVLPFYDAKDQRKKGTWANFFLKNEATWFAIILSIDIDLMDEIYYFLRHQILEKLKYKILETPNIIFTISIERIYKKGKFNFFKILDELDIPYMDNYHFIFELLKKIEDWYHKIKELFDEEDEFIKNVENVLDYKIAEALQKFEHHLEALSNQSTKYQNSINLGQLPHLQHAAKQSDIIIVNIFALIIIDANNNLQAIIEEGMEKILDDVDLIYQNIRSIIVELQKLATQALQNNLNNKNNHDPDFGLFLTFLKLFKEPQKQLNQLTKKHLDYYYCNRLGIPFKADTPDEVFVYFNLIDTCHSFLLPQGTLLLASATDEGIVPIYKTTSDVVLNHITVESIKTIFVEKNDKEQTIGIYDAPISNSQNGLGEPFKDKNNTHWPTFGESQKNKSEGYQNMQPSKIGIEIASPILFLKEGKRKIEIDFSVNINNENPFNISRKYIKVLISTIEGWSNISQYSIFTVGQNLTLKVSLPLEFPPITNFEEEELKTYQSSQNPRIRILVRPSDIPDIYHFFEKKTLENIQLKVEVTDMQQMPLFNESGEIDTSTPFQAFGSAPLLDAYMAIGASELFRKTVNLLTFDIEWNDLPRALDEKSNQISFREYYKEYPFEKEVETSTFKVDFSTLKEAKFKPLEKKNSEGVKEEIRKQLFKNSRTTGRIQYHTRFNIKSKTKKEALITPQSEIQPIINYDTSTQTGIIKLQLKEPPYGFGSDLYLPTYNKIAQENAQIMGRRQFLNMDMNGRGIYIPQGTVITPDTVIPSQSKAPAQEIEELLGKNKGTIIPKMEKEDFNTLQCAIKKLKATPPIQLTDDEKNVLKKLNISKKVYLPYTTIIEEGTNIEQEAFNAATNTSSLLPENTEIQANILIPSGTIIPKNSLIVYCETTDENDGVKINEATILNKTIIQFYTSTNGNINFTTIDDKEENKNVSKETFIQFSKSNDSTEIIFNDNVYTLQKNSNITFSNCCFLITHIPQAFQIVKDTNITGKTCIEKGTNIPAIKPLLRPPFIPVMKSFKLGYEASETIDFRQSSSSHVFHIYPFGEHYIEPNPNKKPYLFPYFKENGYCYLGLDNLLLPEEVTIYFELNQSKFADTISKNKPIVKWSYLKDNEWKLFKDIDIKKDGTNGLMNSGIITLNLPYLSNTMKVSILPQGLYWLRASAEGNISLISDTEAINTQAVRAKWKIDIEDTTHFEQALPPYSIKGTQKEIPEILELIQPFPSFGGKKRETAKHIQHYYRRVHELLRHKDRAITIWDFERLVLEEFPNIEFVQCFSRFTNSKVIRTAGKVVVMVIPKSRKAKNIINYPKVTMTILQQIQSYLSCISSIFSAIEVRNPFYQRITVKCEVGFYGAPSYHVEMLNQDLIAFLSPRSHNNHNIIIRETITKEEVIYFILQKDYVKELNENKLELINDTRLEYRNECKHTSQKDKIERCKLEYRSECKYTIQKDKIERCKLEHSSECKYTIQKGKIERCKPWYILDTVKQHDISILTTKVNNQNLQSDENDKSCNPFNSKPNPGQEIEEFCLNLDDIQ